jgi:hypothetical protein
MLYVLDRFVSYAWDNLGSCSFCIRTAFRAAMAGWCLTLLVAALGWSAILSPGIISTVVPLAITGAVALTALWTAHLFVHARKVTLAESREIVQPQAAVSRRAMFPLFVRTLGAAAVMSAAPAFGQAGDCPGGTSACGQFCNDIERGQFQCEFSRPCYDRQGRCFCVNRDGECD